MIARKNEKSGYNDRARSKKEQFIDVDRDIRLDLPIEVAAPFRNIWRYRSIREC